MSRLQHDHSKHHKGRLTSPETAAQVGLPWSIAQPTLVGYRSVGIGIFGAVMRFTGMPLEKIALFMNSSQVSGTNQFAQAVRLTFSEGALAPYRVVGPASLTAWFLQYSVMGVAFQFVDQTLSKLLGVRPVYYGLELMDPPPKKNQDKEEPLSYQILSTTKTFMAPFLAASMESFVSNRAEVQRYFGPDKFAQIEQSLNRNLIAQQAGPAFCASAMRNVIMCQTSFVLTPITYKLYFPQEHKSVHSLFWYGLTMNIFVGNVVAITQQALWGRSLDYLQQQGNIRYTAVIRQGLAQEGLAAFFTVPKWFSRVLMNAPAQGTLPWFYNEVLPLGEAAFLTAVKAVYEPLTEEKPTVVFRDTKVGQPAAAKQPLLVNLRRMASPATLRRTRSNIGSLPTAHPEFASEEDFDHHRTKRRSSWPSSSLSSSMPFTRQGFTASSPRKSR